MRKAGAGRALPVLLICLGGWLPACDAPAAGEAAGSASPSATAKDAERCRQLIGTAGVDWAEKGHGSQVVESGRDVQDVGEAVRRFGDTARAWTPDADEDFSFRFLPDVCRLVPSDARNGDGLVTLKAGPGTFPLEKLPAGRLEGGGRVTDAGDDVKLVAWELDDRVEHSAYVRCRAEGAMSGQETRVPLEVTMTDHLDQDAAATPRFDLLLDAARVIADEAGCVNDPELPEEAPEG
ncbi:hypothetical protein [Streptomyces chilikensis]|uniref:Lipoprotein n=1 Tax=Streptomyces chilikensis TaxID=1194079 RepID=A0ABV3EZD6_9ACTN